MTLEKRGFILKGKVTQLLEIRVFLVVTSEKANFPKRYIGKKVYISNLEELSFFTP